MKIEPRGFADMGYDRKRVINDKSEDFGPSKWKDETAIYKIGRIIGTSDHLSENLRSSVLIIIN